MLFLATDLDRTLLPNGNQPYDGSLPLFSRIVKEKRITCAYVTGRHLALVLEAISEYDLPLPDFIVASVGTELYRKDGERYVKDLSWDASILRNTRDWHPETFKEELNLIKGLRLQEEDKQNRFKLSYYLDSLEEAEPIVREVTKLVKMVCKDAAIVYSVDETHGIGLLDILPRAATKLGGVEHLRQELKLTREQVVYSGDSGNDLLPLTAGYKAILVRNATDEVKVAVKGLATQNGLLEHLYVAQGWKGLNGFYVSGIIEGLIRYGLIDEKWAEKKTE